MSANNTSSTSFHKGSSKDGLKEDQHLRSTPKQDSSTPSSKSSPIPVSVSNSPSDRLKDTKTRPTHQRFVLTDPVAFRYLEEDPLTTVLERRRRLEGYELYVVEQWACSRVHPTFVITTYTGDASHSVLVGVLSVPTDEDTWSPRLRVYFKAVSQFHARRKDTSLGTLMVTNLSGFPSALTVIPVPEGDVKKHREDFIVNENLKRLGCSGRAGLSLSAPTGATQAKFHQLYRTSDRIPLYSAVIELVKLCQVALMLFANLAPEYADGLLCDVTEDAINKWWTELGTEFYNIEPHDGILGPTTVSALLGMLMGARNRLNAYGAPVSKDVFDIGSLKRGVGYFQKSQKLPRTRRLDRQTLDRLHKVTAKAASGEGWMMPLAVKSTVAELSGKGGDMVMGMVGAREKAGIGDVETLDIEQFVQLVHGERSKWLWYGKPRKGAGNELLGKPEAEEGMVFGKDRQGGYAWSSKKRLDSAAGDYGTRKREGESIHSRPSLEIQVSAEVSEKDPQSRRTVMQSVTGRMNDARSGLGRIKDAVGLPGFRGHHHRLSKEQSLRPSGGNNGLVSTSSEGGEVPLTPISSVPAPSPTSPQMPDGGYDKTLPLMSRANKLKIEEGAMSSTVKSGLKLRSQPTFDSTTSLPSLDTHGRPGYADDDPDTEPDPDENQEPKEALTNQSTLDMFGIESSVAGSGQRDGDYQEQLSSFGEAIGGVGILLRRTQSDSRFLSERYENRNDDWAPRHLSFSIAEDAVLTWENIGGDNQNITTYSTDQSYVSDEAKRLREQIRMVEAQCCAWVQAKIRNVETMDAKGSKDQEELNTLYHQRLREYDDIRTTSIDLLAEERSHLTEAVEDVKVQGAMLDYELNALKSKVHDVEASVVDFEQQVVDIEARALELENLESIEGWSHWVLRMITGIGREGNLVLGST
ncbi:MAG: hypothetical protein M1812_003503 [Candelaria pacifica]|nr:MAG: hypothetical protein M1812_003503 [Candelaria pacifica]